MFDNVNPYTLRIDVTAGIPRYYVSFKDGQSVMREVEVSRPVYLEFCRFKKQERNMRRWDERYTTQFLLSEETLHNTAFTTPKSVEDGVIENERNELLRQAIAELPEIQRRRFILYHEFGLTYEQIAEMEGCSHPAVIKTVKAAKEKILKILSEQGYN